MVYYRNKYKCKLAEIWYNNTEIPFEKSDIIKYKFVEEIIKNAISIESLFTIHIDLIKPEDLLFSQFKKNTRYEINRAMNKDNIICETYLASTEKNDDKINLYMEYYNKFADSKNRYHLSFTDIEQFYNTNTLCIRRAISADYSKIFSMHAYIIADNKSRLLQSSSNFREFENIEIQKLYARANRFLHWTDMLYFKNLGLSIYDLGGWYGGNILKEQILINKFKESFGGEKIKEFTFFVPVTTKGKFFIFFRKAIKAVALIKNHV